MNYYNHHNHYNYDNKYYNDSDGDYGNNNNYYNDSDFDFGNNNNNNYNDSDGDFGNNNNNNYNDFDDNCYSRPIFDNSKNNAIIYPIIGRYFPLKNYILAEFYIDSAHLCNKTRIISSNKRFNLDKSNEEEISKCKIEIDNIEIPFSYTYKFTYKRTYKIKYSFYNSLLDISFMFDNCKCLTNIDLSHFNTRDVTNMSYMFRAVPL